MSGLIYFRVIQKSTGKVLRDGACDSNQYSAQAGPDEEAIPLSQPADKDSIVVIGSDAPSLDPTTGSTVKPAPSGKYTDPETGEEVTTPTGYVLSKPYNSCAVDKTTFKANGGATTEGIVTITGVADNAKVDIVPAESTGIFPIYDAIVLEADHTIQITATEAGQYTVDIDDGTSTHYRVILNATL